MADPTTIALGLATQLAWIVDAKAAEERLTTPKDDWPRLADAWAAASGPQDDRGAQEPWGRPFPHPAQSRSPRSSRF